jgi:chromosome segregation ATPase
MAVKAVKKDKDGESYYSKVKAENEALKERVAWLDNESFLLDSNADIRQVYIYMKKNPASARFIYQKYKPLQPIIKELCDPENPLYLDGVKKALDGIVDLESDKENVEKLKAEIAKENHEIQLLRQEIEQAQTEYDEIHENLERIKKESDEYNKQRSNVRTDAGLELIQKNTTDVTSFIDSVMEKWKAYFKEHVTALGMELSKSELSHMDLLNQNLKDMLERIHSDDFLSTENLDAYHKELLERVRQEKENALNEMNSFMAYNPRRLIPKVVDDINLSIRHFQKADVDMSGLKWFNGVGQGQVLNPLSEALGLLDHMQDQVDAIKRREK